MARVIREWGDSGILSDVRPFHARGRNGRTKREQENEISEGLGRRSGGMDPDDLKRREREKKGDHPETKRS